MNWLGIIVIAIGAYLALKVAGFALKLVLWGLVLLGAYWLLAPYLGLPLPLQISPF